KSVRWDDRARIWAHHRRPCWEVKFSVTQPSITDFSVMHKTSPLQQFSSIQKSLRLSKYPQLIWMAQHFLSHTSCDRLHTLNRLNPVLSAKWQCRPTKRRPVSSTNA